MRSIYSWVQTLELLKTETDNKFPNTSSWIKSSQSGHCATVFWFETRESRNFWTLRQISFRLWFHLSKERFYTNSFVLWDSISQSCWRNFTCTIYNVCYCTNKPRISVNVVFIVHSGSNNNNNNNLFSLVNKTWFDIVNSNTFLMYPCLGSERWTVWVW